MSSCSVHLVTGVFGLVTDKSKRMRTEMKTIETSKSSMVIHHWWTFEEWRPLIRIYLGFFAFCYIYNYPFGHVVGHSHSLHKNQSKLNTPKSDRSLLPSDHPISSHFTHFRLFYAQGGHGFDPYPCPFVPGAVPAMDLTGSRWKDLQETMPRREAMGQLSGESPEA